MLPSTIKQQLNFVKFNIKKEVYHFQILCLYLGNECHQLYLIHLDILSGINITFNIFNTKEGSFVFQASLGSPRLHLDSNNFLDLNVMEN